MDKYLVKNIADNRAQSDIGAAIFVKRGGDDFYHLWLAVTNIPATGSEPETIDTTVTTSRTSTSTPGRINPGQKVCTFMAHRDNFEILKKDNRKTLDFLQVNPDGTGYKFQAEVTSYQNEVTVGGNLTGSAVLTVKKADEEPLSNVADLIQETVTFASAISGLVKISLEEGAVVENVETDPADATVTVESDTTGVATATVSEGKLTITPVKAGSALVKLIAKKANCADGITHILVVVE